MSTDVVRFGIVGLDGHGPAFADKVNGPDSQIEGARVTAAMSVPSVMISQEALQRNVESTRALGVRIVEEPEELASEADGILILHDDGSKHLELARRCASLGKPIFVDKPFETSARKAREIVELSRSGNCPVFTASSLTFSHEIRRTIDNEAGGRILSAMTYSPYSEKPTMPGWIYYGVHAVEPLYALMGPGCAEVRCVSGNAGPVATGAWKDGRLGIAKAISEGARGYGFVAWRENATELATVDSGKIYAQLLERIKTFVETGIAPTDPDESVEVIAFMEAANESMARGGEAVPIQG